MSHIDPNEQIIRSLRIDWSRIDQSSYLREIPAIASLDQMEFRKPVTFFVGENGSGKSTLLEHILELLLEGN